MLAYARSLVGKPFSNVGMARSIVFPRKSDGNSFFCAGTLFVALKRSLACADKACIVSFVYVCVCCARTRVELVASILKKGGLMSQSSNPGAATPQSLHKLYKNQAAATANPYTLRTFTSTTTNDSEKRSLLGFQGMLSSSKHTRNGISAETMRSRSDSPPRASFRCVSTSSASTSYRGLKHTKT